MRARTHTHRHTHTYTHTHTHTQTHTHTHTHTLTSRVKSKQLLFEWRHMCHWGEDLTMVEMYIWRDAENTHGITEFMILTRDGALSQKSWIME